MAESLTAEQIEERRTNLRAFRKLLEMDDDSQLTTTLLMQEEWLATVDELQGYVQDAQRIRGLRLQRCLRDAGALALDCQDCYSDIAEYCASCYLRAIHKPVTEDEEPADTYELLRRHWQDEPLPPLDIVDDRPECEANGQGHVWVRLGTVVAGMMEWGPSKCLLCNEPYDLKFEEEPTHVHTHSHPGASYHEHGHEKGHHTTNMIGGVNHGP